MLSLQTVTTNFHCKRKMNIKLFKRFNAVKTVVTITNFDIAKLQMDKYKIINLTDKQDSL